MEADGLEAFDPIVADWFRSSLGPPSDVQRGTWEAIAAGRHVLATAPTGSGKTLAAFLVALDKLLRGDYPAGRLSVLYVSPLKALNTDIRRNLSSPLEALRARFADAGRTAPAVRVGTRSGDTDAAERRGFLSAPPEILATTPESLALLLNSPRARMNLSSVRLVVLDEIHALLPSKRGAFLVSQLERLVLLSGEFQRVALSATVADPADAARFVGGFAPAREGRLEARPVALVGSGLRREIELSIRYPELPAPDPAAPATESPSRWPVLIDSFAAAAEDNRTTLIFVNSRRHAEKIAFLMNEGGRELAWAHHGSLSREVRAAVEERLKAGSLPVVVATSSLELGIDIGSIDEVVLAGTPAGAAAARQRIGRAGHRIGSPSRARLFPVNGWDLLLAAALAPDIEAGRLEAEARPRNCLDVLAQFILSCAALDEWTEDGLYALCRRSAAFETLSREDYDAVVAMLRGRYDNGRLPSLMPRLDRGAGPGVLRAKDAVLPLLYRAGGVIPDRGSYALRLAESRAPLGELDEEFVWERRLGDTFTLGTRAWRIVGMDERNVFVAPSGRAINIVPFWRAESQWRSEEAMLPVLELLDRVSATTGPGVRDLLSSIPAMDAGAAEALASYLAAQRDAASFPGLRRAVLERFSGPDGQGRYAFLHTGRGGRVNATLGIALRSVADERLAAEALEFFWDDEGILFSYTREEAESEIDIPALFRALAERGIGAALRETLESSGLFGAAFRENAGRALLLPRADFGKRTPLWMTRLRSKRLYEEVRAFADFPLVKETWRSCLEDVLQPEAAGRYLAALVSGAVALEVRESASPSPFARGSVWIASDSFMYRRDDGMERSALRSDLLDDLLAEGNEGPALDPSLVADYRARSARTAADYRPRDPGELADWLDERRVLDAAEYAALRDAVVADGASACDAAPSGSGLIPAPATARLSGAERDVVLSPDLPAPYDRDLVSLLARWLRYEGPVPERTVRDLFGRAGLEALRALRDERAVVPVLVAAPAGAEDAAPRRLFCEAEYASRLFLAARSSRRALAEAAGVLPLSELQAEAARRQGVSGAASPVAEVPPDPDEGAEGLRAALEPLLGRSSPTALWEREIFPARCAYRPYYLELLMARTSLRWYGAGEGRTGFSLEDEFVYSDRPSGASELSPAAASLLDSLGSRAGGAGPAEADRDAALRELVRAGLVSAPRFASAEELDAPRRAVPARDSGRGSAAPYGAYRPKSAFPVRSRWERSRESAALWTPLPAAEPPRDAAEAQAALRERARRALARFGVLSRSIAALEEGAPPWSDLFGALRLMELAGETVGGRFFSDLDELQFVPADGFPARERTGGAGGLYCLAARDPASLCGLPQLARALDLPPRAAGNHVVWRGASLVLVSRANGRDLSFRTTVREEGRDALALLCRRLAERAVDPVRSLVVETVDGQRPDRSPWAETLAEAGFVPALKGMEYIPRRT